MKRSLLFLFLFGFTVSVSAQSNADKDAIKKTIITFFEGMRKADTVMMRSVMAKNMVLQSVGTKNGTGEIITESVSGFLTSVAKPHTQVYDERVLFSDIKIDGDLASVWAPYKFYLGSQFSHCGVDVFSVDKD